MKNRSKFDLFSTQQTRTQPIFHFRRRWWPPATLSYFVKYCSNKKTLKRDRFFGSSLSINRLDTEHHSTIHEIVASSTIRHLSPGMTSIFTSEIWNLAQYQKHCCDSFQKAHTHSQSVGKMERIEGYIKKKNFVISERQHPASHKQPNECWAHIKYI